MIRFGKQLARELSPNSIVLFRGDLGSGKTTLSKGIIGELAHLEPEEVSSPTFTYLNEYGSELKIYHFDLYRLGSSDEFYEMGFDEFFRKGGVCLIEWAERLEQLPPSYIEVELSHCEEGRMVEVRRVGECEVPI